MKAVLLDTNALLWMGLDPHRRTPALEASLTETDIHVSEVSALEMAIKTNLGKLPLPPPFQTDFAAAFRQMANRLTAKVLPVSLVHADRLFRLPLYHRDPFDRMLIAQALESGLTVVTSDRAFELYPGLSVLKL